MIITEHPLHGSGRAGLPHPALASGKDAHASKRIRMANASGRQVALDQPFHSFPKDSPLLAATAERAMPEAGDLETEPQQGSSIHGHTVVLEVSPEYTAQPLADFRNGIVHPSLEFGFDLCQFRLQPRPLGLPQDRKHSIPVIRVRRGLSSPSECALPGAP